MKRILPFLPALLAMSLCAAPARAAESIRYYSAKDSQVKTAVIDSVRKDDLTEFNGFVRIAGRRKNLKLPMRHVIELLRGDSEALNQWSRVLATGRRLMASGQYATVGNTGGAEETFSKVAYSTWKGTPGQEKTERCLPWHNKYGVFYLIETRYRMGQEGLGAKYEEALKTIEEFRKRSAQKAGRKIKGWDVPGPKGTTMKGEVFGWGETRLLAYVTLYEARIHRAMGDKAKSVAAYDQLIDAAKKKNYPPALLAIAVQEKASTEADGQDSEKQESIFRAAGNTLSSLAKVSRASHPFAEGVLRKAANEAFLQGADLLFESALAKKVTFDLPLKRYTQLRESEGKRDVALFFGAQAGIGACLVEKGQGEQAYMTLLEVVTGGGDHPAQTAQALYYIAKAAPLFAEVIERSGGDASFLREEAPRWLNDLKERYPTSKWTAKISG